LKSWTTTTFSHQHHQMENAIMAELQWSRLEISQVLYPQHHLRRSLPKKNKGSAKKAPSAVQANLQEPGSPSRHRRFQITALLSSLHAGTPSSPSLPTLNSWNIGCSRKLARIMLGGPSKSLQRHHGREFTHIV
jgi:hypothetical protein